MKPAYIYPNAQKNKEITNPYLKDFVYSLSNHFYFVNKDKPAKAGIADVFKYINKIEIIFFHWIEELPDKKGGYIQSLLFIILLFILKIKRVKVFYTLHNKESHYTSNNFLKKVIKRLILRQSNYIVCHASSGLNIVSNTKKVKYIPHPFRITQITFNSQPKTYDILIWGSIKEYKGVDAYLKYLKSRNLENKYNTLIVGKVHPPEYETELLKYKSKKITIENKFINDDTLNKLIAQTSIVLFTYNEKSVLSSGALVYSLSQGALVIGPKAGAFHDLKNEGIIDVFENYDQLIEKVDFYLKSPNSFSARTEQFAKDNSWENFGNKIAQWVKPL